MIIIYLDSIRDILTLMDSIAGYQPKAYASLDQIATLMGFPGKLGISGSDVLRKYLE